MTDPKEIIYDAIRSAFVKYPKEDDPRSPEHWIEPEDAAHLVKAVFLELEAAGYQIVRKSN